MTVLAPSPSMAYAAKQVAKRAGIRRPRPKKRVPRLRVAPGRTTTPTLWMICPDWDRPSGGIRKQYRAVDVLNEAGLSAAVVHTRPGFRCTWFEHRTRIVSAAEIVVGEGDVIAVPEIYGPSILDLPAGVPHVIFNQNAYLSIDSLVDDGPEAAAPYLHNPDLAAVVVVSDDNADVVRYAFPGAPVKRIHHGLDRAVHHPPETPPGRRIAYMTRRRRDEAKRVLRLLELRGALDQWDVVAIDGKTEREVAELLRSSAIFLSFSQLEGFGLPPVEAMACGCLVVGFEGFAGREFFRRPFAIPVQDGDVVAYARAVEELMARIDADPAAMLAVSEAGARFVAERYSREVERRDLVDVFGPLLES